MKFDPNIAKEADHVNTQIRESGKYICEITRAEALTSRDKGTKGLGLSVKAEDGSTAAYLDVYYEKKDGEALPGMKTVQAIMGCLKLREPKLGTIKCQKWNKVTKSMEDMQVPGYPEMIGKSIGLLLQKELTTNQDSVDATRLNIFCVFEAGTGFTISEILAKKTKPEILDKQYQYLMQHPVRDSRNKKPVSASQSHANMEVPFDDDIPF
jgi:hypothetical protein